ncbi:MAG: type I-C CRISPR-associated endonuclease Cas1c [Methylacidiphilales bacterium]|nr:type I-C CRISPR-associated endonuclease Cas1c [Candidatus Methylacidiphilales bacterium]
MPEIIQNVLYLTTPGLYIQRDHLTFLIERDGTRLLSLPAHHIESICIMENEITLTHGAMQLALEHAIPIHYLDEHGRLRARVTAIPDTSVTLRRDHYRAADDPTRCLHIAQAIIAGKLHNCRNSLLRGARETSDPTAKDALQSTIDALARLIQNIPDTPDLDSLRGLEGAAAQAYFSAFNHLLKQQQDPFTFRTRSRYPPLDRINCLLSFLYALVRHDCISALTVAGLDPFVGFLHAERPNRPALALDLMEEFRPWLADRLAITLINRQQIQPHDFILHPGGAVELTPDARKTILKAYQERKRENLHHPVLDQQITIGRHFFVQARILARVLRGDLPQYLPHIPK